MKKKLVKMTALLYVIVIFGFSRSVYAETIQNVQSYSDEKQIVIYIPNLKEKISAASAQIGNAAVADVQIKKIGKAQKNYIHTTILFDNSLSISSDNRNKMKEVVKRLINSHVEGEKFTLATFDTEMHELSVDSTDYEELIMQTDSIEFANQDTYLKNILYDVFKQSETTGSAYQNYVILSDGSDDNDVGYTYNEIINLLKDHNYAIYSVGSRYESNIDALEEMFSISRASESSYFLLDETEDINAIVNQIIQDIPRNIAKIKIPESVKDGETKSIKLTINTSDDSYSLITEAKMPFADMSVKKEAERVEKKESETETKKTILAEKTTENKEAGGEIPNKEENKILLSYMLIGIIAVVVIVLIAVLLILIRKRSKVRENNKEKDDSTILIKSKDDKTILIDKDDNIIESDNDAGPEGNIVNIRLTDIRRPAVMMEYSLSSSVILGRTAERSQIIFDYEKSVSGQHCELSRGENNKIYIQDLESSNGTYVNGEQIKEKEELLDGSIIKMGRLQIEFQIINVERAENGKGMIGTSTEVISDLYDEE